LPTLVRGACCVAGAPCCSCISCKCPLIKWKPPGAKLEKKMGCAKVSSRKPSSPDDDGEEEEAGVEGNETGGNHNK
jgi:hypothetical protein